MLACELALEERTTRIRLGDLSGVVRAVDDRLRVWPARCGTGPLTASVGAKVGDELLEEEPAVPVDGRVEPEAEHRHVVRTLRTAPPPPAKADARAAVARVSTPALATRPLAPSPWSLHRFAAQPCSCNADHAFRYPNADAPWDTGAQLRPECIGTITAATSMALDGTAAHVYKLPCSLRRTYLVPCSLRQVSSFQVFSADRTPTVPYSNLLLATLFRHV